MSSKFRSRLEQFNEGSCECGPSCCPGAPKRSEGPDVHRPYDAPWAEGRINAGRAEIPVVVTKLSFRDRAGHWRVRWGIRRMSYTVPPGLYAVGAPDAESPVFVSANYKFSFDLLRASLDGLNAWVLVLDTQGINVWCAAGKGTFGTDELVRRIEDARLALVVSHRTLILPQLGASNVAAHEVAKRAKFRVVYGPVKASDIKAFMGAGMKATPVMRRVRFPLRDRLALVPEELAGVFSRKIVLVLAAVWLAGVLGVRFLRFDGPAVLGAILVGTVLVPLLLPWIPGRPFAWKGWLLGLAWAAAVLAWRGFPPAMLREWAAGLSYLFILPAVSAFLAMGFTGSSTFTSLSGVVKEMKTAVPLMALSGILGIAATVASAVLGK
ncbi:MAG: acetyl-CoA synthase subunit gamma [Candidatus Aminicenantes bacterium]|nr:acetyl-CoA synthase subunit gamma [Candidatus Aminicenantes bacterium]